jgi:excinuclease ABC subunit A
MAASDIVIKGAREHNLRDVHLTLPRNQLICFTGVSGSGKSSLAFDTLYAEGQRRYIESLSSFARQFLGQMPKPDVDLISGLSPSISISQKSGGQNPRSTVGTITEIYDFLRVLYARVGVGHCPECGKKITAQTRQRIIDRILSLPKGTKFLILTPVVSGQKGAHRDLFRDLLKQGYLRARVDGEIVRLSDELGLDRRRRHDIEVVIDRLTIGLSNRARLAEAVESALKVGEGRLIVSPAEPVAGGPDEAAPLDESDFQSPEMSDESEMLDEPDEVDESEERGEPASEDESDQAQNTTQLTGDLLLSSHYACTDCDLSFEPPSPQLFSFNSPRGMCRACDGLGEIHTFSPDLLVLQPTKSFQQGAIEPLGNWRGMGRWRRHIFRGVADTIERTYGLEPGTVLETAWEELDQPVRNILLWGAGDLHVTYTWRAGPSGHKWGGKFEGIIPKMLSQYKSTKSKPQRRALERYMCVLPCHVCGGDRLNEQGRSVKLTTSAERFQCECEHDCSHEGDASEGNGKHSLSLPDICRLPISDAREFFDQLELDDVGRRIAEETLKEIRGRLGFLSDVGLDYLALERTAPTLSGGELQRIRLAGQIGCGLVGVLYILDEPSIGLHPRDNDRLLGTLQQLRDQGNTVIVVEHDEDTMRAADQIVDFGPGPGIRGGHVVAEGSLEEVLGAKKSITAQYLSGKRRIPCPEKRREIDDRRIAIRGARHNNLKNIDVEIPLGALVCVTGVSGSGKSSLINDILRESLFTDLNRGDGSPGAHDAIEGIEHLDKIIAIDQSPIGRTPRSNPATYVKVFDEIRKLYAQLPDAKARGYAPGRFSFNVSGGRCEACEGNGAKKLEMDFLADVWVTCPMCEGRRFNYETLQVRYKGKSIAEVLNMDVQEALEHFEKIPKISRHLQTLHDVGLDYMKIGQPSPTLSGGEAQRIKLAKELTKRSTGKTLYLLDEPTTGLHFADIEMLLKVLHDFADAGNTVLIVEHNLDVVKTADWVIDLGPEGGEAGGRLIAEGTPEQVAECDESHTGVALRSFLDLEASLKRGEEPANKKSPLPGKDGKTALPSATEIIVQGAQEHNLKNVDVRIPRDQMTVCCGPSGSGKTSLAMDTVYAEGQRRYVESLSSYARQFVGRMQKPKLDHIEGLSPAIAIEQKHTSHSPRSTVGTVTELYDYLRILTSRLGTPYCPDCDIPIGTQTADEIIAKIMSRKSGSRLYLTAPVALKANETYEDLWRHLRASGYARVRIDSKTYELEDVPTIDRRRRHRVEVLIDRIVVRKDNRSRIADSVEDALSVGRGVLNVVETHADIAEEKWKVETHSRHFTCDKCDRSFEQLSPHHFSFNSSLGWCPACEGLGTQVGANPNELLSDSLLSIAEGAIDLWPDVSRPLTRRMIESFSEETGVPLDVPFDQLGARHRRLVFQGTGDLWFPVYAKEGENCKKAAPKKTAKKKTPVKKTLERRELFRFQYKGLFPTLEEAGRLVASFRHKLDHLVDEVECSVCGGSRLRDDAAAVQLEGHSIDEHCRMPLDRLLDKFEHWKPTSEQRKIAGELHREIQQRLKFLIDVGLDYLTLGRPAPSLSGGESQRIRLAAQIGSGLCGVLYVLDEPTIGLHPRDNRRLIDAMKRLRDLGNTLLVVEHDREVVAGADQLLDFGPKAGKEGGQVVARGTPEVVSKRKASVTGPYLTGEKSIAVPSNRRMPHATPAGERLYGQFLKASKAKNPKKDAPKRRRPPEDGMSPIGAGWLEIRGARENNLKSIDVEIPLGSLTVVTGPSGSGKSSLVDGILHPALSRQLHRATKTVGAHDAVIGIRHINKVIQVDQKPIGQTPTSNPATFTGAFELIRQLFAQLPEAKIRGYSARRFSFNVPGGRCEKCEGNGQLKIEMHFLPDVWVTCDACNGQRYEPETLSVRYHGYSIADVLDMSCRDAVRLFANVPKIRRVLKTLCDVGLDYVTLGQSAPTLSGGEAQRVKLAAELARPDTGRTLYLLDEPTTGLHFDDLAKLLEVLNRLVDLGNTVVVIEHNMDVVKTADWVVDLGPEAGYEGGRLVACGTPEDLTAHARQWTRAAADQRKGTHRSYTGECLDPILKSGPYEFRSLFDFEAEQKELDDDLAIEEIGGEVQAPWSMDGRSWHTVHRQSRNGKPCRWDGKILGDVVDRIHDSDLFSETDWSNRSVVEIRAEKKSNGWFFHAITGEEWLLKMKFRVPRNSFKKDELVKRLDLKPLNDMPELPLYGTESRTIVHNVRGPWQEIELKLHGCEEIDRPEFHEFMDEAISAFGRHVDRAEANPNDLTPWKVLGRKWHESRKGFNVGRPAEWDGEVLTRLFEILEKVAPESEAVWTNKVIVPLHLKEANEKWPWAVVGTKYDEAVQLTLSGPKGRFALGRILSLGDSPELDGSREDYDLIKLRFRTMSDIRKGGLVTFLKEHRDAFQSE